MHSFLAISCLLLTAGDSPTDAAVRATIERSLPFIQREGQEWIDEKKCVTCHQAPFTVWSLNAAADRGIVLDEQRRADCGAWAIDWKHMATKEDLDKGEEHTLERHNDPAAQLMLGRSVKERDESDALGTGVALYALAGDGLSADHPAITRGRQFLFERQQAAGSWKVEGTKKDKAKKIEPTATYWGTCWAVIGLAETLPRAK
jgi:squalene-hopene/tetraprenyl-beta-curcumene cyclase